MNLPVIAGPSVLNLVSVLLLFVLSAFVLGACQQTRPVPTSPSEAGPLALVGGTIYVSPQEEPIREGVVLIQDETIVAVASDGPVEGTCTLPLLDLNKPDEIAAFVKAFTMPKPHRMTSIS